MLSHSSSNRLFSNRLATALPRYGLIGIILLSQGAIAQLQNPTQENAAATALPATADASSASFAEKATTVTLKTLHLGWVGLQHTAELAVQATSLVYQSLIHWWSGDPRSQLQSDHIVRHLKREGGSPFSQLVDAAGYEFTEIKIGSGIIPALAFGFEHDHHISETKEAELRQQLELHQQQFPDLLGSIERQIIYMLLDADDFGRKELDLVEVTITILPWPGIDVVLDPQGAEPTTEDILEMGQADIKKEDTEISQLQRQLIQLRKTTLLLQQELAELRQPTTQPTVKPAVQP